MTWTPTIEAAIWHRYYSSLRSLCVEQILTSSIGAVIVSAISLFAYTNGLIGLLLGSAAIFGSLSMCLWWLFQFRNTVHLERKWMSLWMDLVLSPRGKWNDDTLREKIRSLHDADPYDVNMVVLLKVRSEVALEHASD